MDAVTSDQDVLAMAVLATRWPDGGMLTGVTKRTAQMIAEQVAPLLAEAEARGVARGRREALTEAADVLDAKSEAEGGLYAGDCTEWLRARAGETPGGGA